MRYKKERNKRKEGKKERRQKKNVWTTGPSSDDTVFVNFEMCCFARWNETRCCPKTFFDILHSAAMLRGQKGFGEVYKVFNYKINPRQ